MSHSIHLYSLGCDTFYLNSCNTFKGKVHPKMKSKSLFNMSFQTYLPFFFCGTHTHTQTHTEMSQSSFFVQHTS